MNDDIEQLLGRLTPSGVRPELRPQVLAAVASQLQTDRESRRFRWSALAVTASIALGVALNISLSRASDRRYRRALRSSAALEAGHGNCRVCGKGDRCANGPMGLPATCSTTFFRRWTCGLRGVL